MRNNEKSQFSKAVIVILLLSSLIMVIVSVGRLFSIENSLHQYAADIASVKIVDPEEASHLTERISEIESSLASKKEKQTAIMSGGFSDTGSKARALLEANGMKTTSYRTSKSNNTMVFEFEVKGPILSFVNFLQEAARNKDVPQILGFRLSASPDGAITSTVRIGYE